MRDDALAASGTDDVAPPVAGDVHGGPRVSGGDARREGAARDRLTPRERRLLRGTVRRWELIPFVVAIVAIFVTGVVMTNRIADERVADVEAETVVNRGIITTLVDAICTEAEAERIDVRRLVQALIANAGPATQATVQALLDTTLPENRECLAQVLIAINEADADTDAVDTSLP